MIQLFSLKTGRKMLDFLTASQWQGIAGLAQILAAILAIVTIRQTSKMMVEADRQRRESVAPYWLFLGADVGIDLDRDKIRNRATFVNSGLGPARDVTPKFWAYKQKTALQVFAKGFEPDKMAIPPDCQYVVTFDWRRDQPIEGSLTIAYVTRLNENLTGSFRHGSG